MVYPAPLESYKDVWGTLNLVKFAHLHTKLMQVLHHVGLSIMIRSSSIPVLTVVPWPTKT
jgi:hypothetical protein